MKIIFNMMINGEVNPHVTTLIIPFGEDWAIDEYEKLLKVKLNILCYEISTTKRSRVFGVQNVLSLGAHLVLSIGGSFPLLAYHPITLEVVVVVHAPSRMILKVATLSFKAP